MSHHIYTTPGFVVKSSPHQEAGKFFYIFTRELGMVGTIAQGVRLNQSKLRFHVQDYSYSLFSLVRGKEVWRVTGAGEFAGILPEENMKLYAKILSLLERLLPGEEKNERLFEVMDRFHEFLSRGNLAGKAEPVEIATVLRILDCLGYVSKKDLFAKIVETNGLSQEVFEEVKSNKALIIKEINNALKESQL